MNCEEARVLLHAYLDDELDAAASLAMAQHLAGCAGCTQRYRGHARLQQALRDPALRVSAPAALRARLAARLPAPQPAARAARRWPALAAALAAALALTVTLATWQTLRPRAPAGDALVAEAVSGHVRALLAEHLLDVPSSDQHTVKPWFDGRLDYAPQVKDLVAEGFPLAGGRLDVLDGRRVAALVYRRHRHVINLYQWPAADGETGTRERDGYRVVQWNEDGMHYLAVSDAAAADLDAFVRAFRGASAAGAEPAR
ncbi:anti-sigma factor family protein [Mizugakiibacter sediminis]|uniref:anti-sigma factor family protein n=1 Tax=Mizugakiibacter sediminis TaxID=1475481 RepID=UPI000786011C|nr:zf-HC2 domain-containing protein [Mizugakiibacter sediminis]